MDQQFMELFDISSVPAQVEAAAEMARAAGLVLVQRESKGVASEKEVEKQVQGGSTGKEAAQTKAPRTRQALLEDAPDWPGIARFHEFLNS